MRSIFDGKKNRAYVYLSEFEDADVQRSYTLHEHDVQGWFMFDFDRSGRLLGFEVRFASGALPSEFLDAAERVSSKRFASLTNREV